MEVKFSEEQNRKLEDIKDRIQKTITPLDVVAGILYYFGGDVDGDFEFQTDHEKIQREFFKFNDDPLLKYFSFKKGGPYPYSELLENIFTRITISDLLSCPNPDYKLYKINYHQRERIKNNSLKKFSEEQQKRLNSISRVIYSNLSLRARE